MSQVSESKKETLQAVIESISNGVNEVSHKFETDYNKSDQEFYTYEETFKKLRLLVEQMKEEIDYL